jgi:hypothetical protein
MFALILARQELTTSGDKLALCVSKVTTMAATAIVEARFEQKINWQAANSTLNWQLSMRFAIIDGDTLVLIPFKRTETNVLLVTGKK